MNPNANDANISDQKDDAFIIRWVKALAFALDFGGLCGYAITYYYHIMGWCRFHVYYLKSSPLVSRQKTLPRVLPQSHV